MTRIIRRDIPLMLFLILGFLLVSTFNPFELNSIKVEQIDYVISMQSKVSYSVDDFISAKAEAERVNEETKEYEAKPTTGQTVEGVNFQEFEAPTGAIREKNVKSMMGKHKLGSSTPRRKMMEGVDGGCSNDGFFIATVEGRYCIALGSAYCKEIGTYIDIVLEDGTTLPCILGDQKADQHTNQAATEYGPAHSYHAVDSSVVEFILYTDNSTGYDGWKSKSGGVIGSMNQFSKLASPVAKIIVYEKRYDFTKVGLSESQVW